VVSDVRFFDSCLFLWLFHTQPLREVGIECEIDFAEWPNVPLRVATRDWSIGFYNRVPADIPTPGFAPSYWTDLTLYRGYSLILSNRHSVGRHDVRGLTGALDVLRRLKNKIAHPRVITIGADTTWRFVQNALVRHELKDCDFVDVPDADVALEQFLAGDGDLFVGGLPQRFQALKHNCIELISADNNPLLFSLNSLIYSGPKREAPPPEVLAAAAGFWFRTIARAKQDENYRNEVVDQCVRMAKGADRAQWLDPEQFRQLLDPATVSPYEVFPARPTDLLDAISEDVFVKVLEHINTTKGSAGIPAIIDDFRRVLGRPTKRPSDQH
jgi:hypothetical protein